MTLFFDELNNLESNLRTFAATGAEELTVDERTARYKDEILDILIYAWSFGRGDAISELGNILGYVPDIEDNTEAMKESIYRVIDDKTFEDRIYEYAPDNRIDDIIRVVETESVHNYNNGKFQTVVDGIPELVKTGKTARKVWNTAADERVRDTHAYLEGMEVGITDKFYTYDGDSAYFPTGFYLPENNVNCRCWVSFVG